MRQIAWPIALLAGALLSTACASPPKVPVPPSADPFLAAGMLDPSIRKLCLRRLALEAETDDSAAALAPIQAALSAELTRIGFEVVTVEALHAVEAEVDDGDGDGPYFDSATGEAFPERVAARADRLREEWIDRLGCDGFVDLDLVTVAAYWSDRVVGWDGRRVSAFGGEVRAMPGRDMREIMVGGVRGWGVVPALSLHLSIHDRTDRVVFWNAAGLELATTVRGGPWKLRFDPVPADRMLRDPFASIAAAAIALDPLGPPPDEKTRACVNRMGSLGDPNGPAETSVAMKQDHPALRRMRCEGRLREDAAR